MRLLLVRHAIAEDRAEHAREGGGDDTTRPLTDRGRRRMKRAARGLATLVPSIDLLATSPLTRAIQTAEILAKRIDVGEVASCDALVPEAEPAATIEWLRQRKDSPELVTLVGHEPHLGRLAGWLVAGRDAAPVELRKGGACLIDVADGIRAGCGTLLWALAPRQLRALAR